MGAPKILTRSPLPEYSRVCFPNEGKRPKSKHIEEQMMGL